MYNTKVSLAMLFLAAICPAMTSANTFCNFTLKLYSDNTCQDHRLETTTSAGGLPIRQCLKSGDGFFYKVQVCDPEYMIAANVYLDEDCTVPRTFQTSQHPPTISFLPNAGCVKPGWGKAYKVEDATVYVNDLSLNANRYGIGWDASITLFTCQVMLAGACLGI